MVTLIHGTDTFLSYLYLKNLRNNLEQKGFESKTINVDDENEITDPTVIYGLLSEQDLFGSQKLLILKRTASSGHFYKLGKALKTSDKLFDIIKSSPNEIILWEDKLITSANPLFKLSKEIKSFNAPVKDYETSSYIQSNFKDLSNEIKKLVLSNLKTTNTDEIATEIAKLKNTPIENLSFETLVLSTTTPSWLISDSITSYIGNRNSVTMGKMFDTINNFEEDIRYKLAIIQNHISEMLYVKRIKTDRKLTDIFFAKNRAFVVQKIDRAIANVDQQFLYDLYKKSLIVEYFLNKGLINENVALEYIFLGDIKSMSSELLLG